MAKVNIPMHAMILRCSWDIKSLNKISSSVFTSMSNYMKCVNNIARWCNKLYSEIYSGVPPTLDDI